MTSVLDGPFPSKLEAITEMFTVPVPVSERQLVKSSSVTTQTPLSQEDGVALKRPHTEPLLESETSNA